ncbi:porin family protein [Patiriisocius hiemis]|uniref:Porin family protein n=1 Tax=Patiriisocius hiemis TaxID=3075604 RepID=A0ABU2YB19_9FLAO|nr:porin family protein [Constantimarinum sp. W242]MDT0554985.1 porin family protein [Constantimarinum sp. W242]
MKKQILLFVAIFFTFSMIYAQAPGEVRFGAKAGVNLAKLTGEDIEDADGKTGFHIGGLVEVPVSEKFSIQPEIIFSQQGLQSKDQFGDVEVESKFKLDYINVPIMGKYYITDGLSIQVGPQIGFTATAEQEVEVEGDGGNELEGTEDVSDSVSGTDISIGGGLEYRLTNGLFFQGRYMFGVSDVGDDDEVFGDSLTNSVLSFSIGFSF